MAKRTVINPEDVLLDTKDLLRQDEETDYLIITDVEFVSPFQELADWKIRRGISTEVKEVSWVLSNYSGYDDPEKIRNCIRDYYANHGTRWVLLAGDTDAVPYREVTDDYIPCDLYFSDLDSNWDADGDHLYGEEEDQVDMYPEVFVGRAPCGDVSEVQTFVEKCLTYEISPETDYQTEILLAAEELWPGTDGGKLKDYIDSSFIPDNFQATKLYQTSGNLDWESFRDGMNDGPGIVNHDGHGDFDALSIGPDAWTNSDMDGLVNGPKYSLLYTGGCNTAGIDADCIGERFVNNPNGGGVAYCGNTRSGWGASSPLEGPSPQFDIEFFRALFDSSTYRVGKTLARSKIPFIPLAQSPYGYFDRYVMYTLVLLGDPMLEVWTDLPAELTVSHAPSFLSGTDYFEVDVDQDSALVCCVKDGQILGTAYSSGGTATVQFDSALSEEGVIHLAVTKHNYVPYHDTLLVVSSGAPLVIYNGHEIDDSGGDDNGVVNPGETVLMSITLENVGTDSSYGVSAVLREDDGFITVTDSVKSFGDIGPGMTGESLDYYLFEVDSLCPDSHLVAFTLEITDAESLWTSSFFQMVVHADFAMSVLSDTALVYPEDSVDIQLTFTPIGGFNLPVNLSHSELPAEVSGAFYPSQVVPPDSSILRIYTTLDASPATHSLMITAAGGEVTHQQELTLSVVSRPHDGPVWHVSPEGDDLTGNGSLEFPLGTIQKGIDLAGEGDTVLVEKGTYLENLNFSGKPILLASHFILDGEVATIESTVIDGGYAGRVVTFNSYEDSNSVIRGFTITRGYADRGGGIYCFKSSPVIADNFVVEDSSDWILDRGTDICCWGSSSRAKVYRNLVTGCFSPAAVSFMFGADCQFVNNTVCDNGWGGVTAQQDANPDMRNNIICGNAAYGIFVDDCSPNIKYNDVFGNDQNYEGIGDLTGFWGNISEDPLFLDPGQGDYHLDSGSPCIDAGDPDDPIPPGGGSRVDMGLFEYLAGPDFTITALPDSVLIPQGGSDSVKLILTSFYGFSQQVNLLHWGLPPGTMGAFDASQLVPTDSTYFRIYNIPGGASGVYPFTISATGGGITHEVEVHVDLRSHTGDVWHVSTEGDDSTGDGSSESPFRTIQKGIDTASDGDTVLADRGRYLENINFGGKAIVVASHFVLDGQEATIESTIIDGDSLGNVVLFDSEEDTNSVILGFTLTRGFAPFGGGIRCKGSSPTIAYNILVENACEQGKGGPGIYLQDWSDPIITRNLVCRSTGPAAIGLHRYCRPKIVNNTVCDNTWGGICAQASSDAYLKNNIIYNNVAYGVCVEGSWSDIQYNDVYGHQEDYAGDIEDQTGISGNISADPLFRNVPAGDYHLTFLSPCKDAGDPADSVPPGGGDRIDMGAFEYAEGPEFSLSVSPDTVGLTREDSASVKVVVSSWFGFDSLVDLSLSELPFGMTGFLDPEQLVPTDSSILRIYTDADASDGIYPITITAAGGGIAQQRQITVQVQTYFGPVWYVSTEGDDSTGNGSEELPFQTIQRGIDFAFDGDTVLAEEGVYIENIDFLGKSILVSSHFILDGRVSTIQSTVIDGNREGSVVTFDSGEDSNSVIRGFTLTGGYAVYGAGVFCDGSSPTISENILLENECIYWAKAGPGIYCANGSNAIIYRNLIHRCSGPSAIALLVGCQARVINNTVCDNTCGGISVQDGCTALVKNNVFCDNGAYGVYAEGSTVEVLYNDVFGHEENYVGKEDQTGINGNISANPLFEDPLSGNYLLTSGSPCVDAGDPADSVPPMGGDRIDMGAFEYPSGFVRGDVTGDGLINVADVVYLVNFLFRGGTEPYPLESGDANSDGEVNVADVVYLVNYLYRGGDPPG